MMSGKEHEASLRDIASTALSLYADDDNAGDVLASSLLRLAYEQKLLIEYLTGAEQEAPLSDHIIAGIGQGIAERLRSLSALASTRMDVAWKPEARS